MRETDRMTDVGIFNIHTWNTYMNFIKTKKIWYQMVSACCYHTLVHK